MSKDLNEAIELMSKLTKELDSFIDDFQLDNKLSNKEMRKMISYASNNKILRMKRTARDHADYNKY